tara:strand:+ start:4390 stop:4881 length:492 start_codon:yes stop_codon:yes gene_type:complete
MKIFIFLLLCWGCGHQLIVNCDDSNYFVTPNKKLESNFKNQQREIITKFSEKELNSLFGDTGVSCKNILADFFYCNICFNNTANYLISYNGSLFNIDDIKDPIEFTSNIITLISSMQIGSDEYSYFLSTYQNSFSKKETKLIQQHFEDQKKDSIIKSIRIETH